MTTSRIHTKDRIMTPGRIVALLAIAVVVAGLAAVHFDRPAGWAEVPSGARAGQLDLEPCSYPTEKGDVRADCGTLVVPENRAGLASRLIALPVTRIRSRSPDPAEPIFRLQGGPGQPNMDFPYASRYIDNHDLVLVGYRGVEGSARLDCPEVESARRHSADLLGASTMRAGARGLRDCADRLRDDGFDLAGYSISQRVDDLDDARRALGYERIDLLSESFGTRIALIYAWRHPQRIHRSVMVGANPPGNFIWKPAQNDAQISRLAALCGSGPECRTKHGDLAATMRSSARDLPDRWGPFPIHRGNVQIASFFGFMESSSDAAPVSAPMTLDAWRAAAEGDASGLWLQSLAGTILFPRMQVWGDTAAMARVDAAAARRHFARGRSDAILGDGGSRFLWGDGAMARAWPASPDEDEYSQMRDSNVPTLVISGEFDGATPAANATDELLPHLRNGDQVVLTGFGHTIDFWDHQVAAGSRLINHYLDTGRVDASRYVPQQIDFTPPVTQTRLAKMFAGALTGLALITLLALAWMARRVRRHGRLPHATRVVTRSAGAFVLGLGGWFSAALVTLIALPSVPIDATLLIISSMAVPVAIASYCAWCDDDRGPSRTAGLLMAFGGALIGAAVGFACATAMLAVLTTLAGAVAGANLALIASDITAETRRRRQVPATPATAEPREALRQEAALV